MTATETTPTLIPDFGDDAATDRKLCFVCSKGSLDMAYPALIMASGALNEGIETHIFFTFWGMDMIHKTTQNEMKFTFMGNPAMHMGKGAASMPQGLGGLPGMTWFATRMLKNKIAELDVPEVPELMTMLHDMGATFWACKMSADMMDLTEEDFIEEVDGIINVGEFIEISTDADIVFI